MSTNLLTHIPKEVKTQNNQSQSGLYWDRMEIFFKMFRFMGYIPFKVNKTSNMVEQPSFQSWLWAGFVSVIQVLVVVMSNSNWLSEKYWNTYDSTLESLLRILYADVAFFFFIGWWESYKIVNHINNWTVFLDRLNKVTPTPVTCYAKNKSKWFLISMLAFAAACTFVDEFTLLDHFNPFVTASNIIVILIPVQLTFFWIANCIFTVQIAKCFRHNLFTTLLTKQDPDIINEYRLLWMRLRQNATDLPQVFGGSVATHIVNNLLFFTISTYSLMTALIYFKDIKRGIGFITPMVWNAFVLISICEFSHLVNKEIGQNMISMVFSLNLVVKRNSTPYAEAIDLLFDTIRGNSSDLTLNGYFSLNRTLLISLIALTVSYNMVLLQFDPSRK